MQHTRLYAARLYAAMVTMQSLHQMPLEMMSTISAIKSQEKPSSDTSKQIPSPKLPPKPRPKMPSPKLHPASNKLPIPNKPRPRLRASYYDEPSPPLHQRVKQGQAKSRAHSHQLVSLAAASAGMYTSRQNHVSLKPYAYVFCVTPLFHMVELNL